MKKIVTGYVYFLSNFFNSKKVLFSKLSSGQSPEVLFITCSDSRVDPNLLTNSEPGELFVIRNAGNIVPPHTNTTCGFAASIEFAINAIGIKHIIVCGHSDCGAMKGALDGSKTKNLPNVQKWLNHTKPAVDYLKAKPKFTKRVDMTELTQQNVLLQIQNLITHPCIVEKIKIGSIDIHGWVYDIGQGSIKVFDESTNLFISFEQFYSNLLK